MKNKKNKNMVLVCIECGSNNITYETVTGKSYKLQLVGGKTISSPVYQDMEYKVCDDCGHRWTGFDDEKQNSYIKNNK